MNAVSDASSLAVATPPRSADELVVELLHLSSDEKLEIITRLARSLQGASVAAERPMSLPAFVCIWTNDPEAGQMEQAILAIRNAASDFKSE